MLSPVLPSTHVLLQTLGAVYLASLMLLTGLQSSAASTPMKRREWLVLLRSIGLNVVLVPMIAFVTVRALRVPQGVAVAILLLGVAPGGRFLPQLARVAKGNVPLAAELTLILAKLTLVSAPLTAKWLLDEHRLHIAEVPLVAQLIVLQFVPYAVGTRIRRRRPTLATDLHAPLDLIVTSTAICLLVLLLVHGGAHGLVLLDSRAWTAVLTIALASLTFGWILGGDEQGSRAVVALSANAKNLALATLIAIQAVPGGNVHVAIFGVWFVFFCCNSLFAFTMATRSSSLSVSRGKGSQP